MKTKGTKSRKLNRIPNNRKLRDLALNGKYSHKLKKVKKNKSFEEKMTLWRKGIHE